VLSGRLDREKQASYNLTLVAYDGGVPPRTGSLSINLTIDDVNDNSPQFDNATYLVRVPENAPVGAQLVRLRATDADAGANALLQYKFTTRSQNLYGSYFAISMYFVIERATSSDQS